MDFSESDLRIMQQVIEITRQGIEKGNWPFGASVVKDGELFTIAHNRVVQAKDPTAHAEANAIRLACEKLGTFDLSGCEIVASCAPCPMCFSAIYWSGIRRVVYGAYPPDYALLGFTSFLITPERMAETGKVEMLLEGGLLRDENRALFELYYQKYGKYILDGNHQRHPVHHPDRHCLRGGDHPARPRRADG